MDPALIVQEQLTKYEIIMCEIILNEWTRKGPNWISSKDSPVLPPPSLSRLSTLRQDPPSRPLRVQSWPKTPFSPREEETEEEENGGHDLPKPTLLGSHFKRIGEET